MKAVRVWVTRVETEYVLGAESLEDALLQAARETEGPVVGVEFDGYEDIEVTGVFPRLPRRNALELVVDADGLEPVSERKPLTPTLPCPPQTLEELLNETRHE